LAGIPGAIEGAAKNALSFEVTGSFSAEEADRMGFGANVQERTAKASEETAKSTKRILQGMGEGQLAFE